MMTRRKKLLPALEMATTSSQLVFNNEWHKHTVYTPKLMISRCSHYTRKNVFNSASQVEGNLRSIGLRCWWESSDKPSAREWNVINSLLRIVHDDVAVKSKEKEEIALSSKLKIKLETHFNKSMRHLKSSGGLVCVCVEKGFSTILWLTVGHVKEKERKNVSNRKAISSSFPLPSGFCLGAWRKKTFLSISYMPIKLTKI